MMGPSKPISWPASQYWDGADGNWSSFYLRVGSPEQVIHALPSTAGPATWVVSPQGCLPGEPGTMPSLTCSQSRGGLFNASKSTSWNSIGNYTMEIESNLGYNNTAAYGLDTVGLGLSNSTGGPSLCSQVVGALATYDFYVGLFGLGQQPTNFTNFTTPHPSFLTTLKAQNLIPSLSWGYNAGAHYQSRGVFGSLTLGGYDSSRIIHNNVSFSLYSDPSRDLVVSLQSITATYSNGSATPFLNTAIWTFIDSTIPYIYLPVDACQRFEESLGLVWNTTYQIYFIDDDLHGSLIAANPIFTFQLSNSGTGGATVDIVLPYASFDLAIDYPLVPSSLRYFPIARAANDTQYTLGRAFLQEAYIVADYEQSNFSVFQNNFEDGLKQNIVAISSTSNVPENHVSQATKIGLSVGLTIVSLLCLLSVALAVIKRRSTRREAEARDTSRPRELSQQPDGSRDFSVQEIDMNSLIGFYRELPDSGTAELSDGIVPPQFREETSELSDPSAPVAYELTAYPSSNEIPIVQNHGDGVKRLGIFVSTDMSRQDSASIGKSSNIPRVETKISSQKLRAVDLDKSLPSTPISESLQVSPVLASFKQRSSKEKGRETELEREARVVSALEEFDEPDSKCCQGKLPWNYSSMATHIVVPQGLSESDIIKPLNIFKKGKRSHRDFF